MEISIIFYGVRHACMLQDCFVNTVACFLPPILSRLAEGALTSNDTQISELQRAEVEGPGSLLTGG